MISYEDWRNQVEGFLAGKKTPEELMIAKDEIGLQDNFHIQVDDSVPNVFGLIKGKLDFALVEKTDYHPYFNFIPGTAQAYVRLNEEAGCGHRRKDPSERYYVSEEVEDFLTEFYRYPCFVLLHTYQAEETGDPGKRAEYSFQEAIGRSAISILDSLATARIPFVLPRGFEIRQDARSFKKVVQKTY